MGDEEKDLHEEAESKCSELRFICDNFMPEYHLEDITVCFRFLRNACTSCSNYQNLIAKHGLDSVEKVLQILVNNPNNSENVQVAIRLGIQVLGNMIVNNNETRMLVWKKCAHILSIVLNKDDEKAANYASMVVYNIILGVSPEELSESLDSKIVKGLLNSACNGSEFGHFTVESLLSISNWLVDYYPELSSREKYYVLDLMCENISKPSYLEGKKKIHVLAIKYISVEFCAHSDKILDPRVHHGSVKSEQSGDSKMTEATEIADPCEITKLLEVLASAASVETYLTVLQSDGSLLIKAIYLLKSIHAMGKLAEEEGNLTHPFASIQKVSTGNSREDVELNPAYGFKRNLIQLIGNLSWKNKEIQNKILELECVPLILECCNIDERNPFITQWAILAIRNLCDGNLEVQQVIAGLKREGVISNELLNEMGLALHDPGDPTQKISIMPLPRYNGGLGIGGAGIAESGGGVAAALSAGVLCSLIPGLTYKQRSICRSAPDAVAAVGVGARLGRNECASQFGQRRWNCTPIGSDTVFGHVVVVGSREAAYTYAITSAGVAYAVTQACSRGNISGCGCDPSVGGMGGRFMGGRRRGKGDGKGKHKGEGRWGQWTNGIDGGVGAWGGNSNAGGGWKWGGCSADVGYGMRFARRFVDAREMEGDSRSLMNLHNNKAGRKAVKATLQTECKCHGVSGSCTLKTCWRTLPPFRVVGDYLMKKYARARPVVAVPTIVPGHSSGAEGPGRPDGTAEGATGGSSQRQSRKAGSSLPRIKLVLKTVPPPRVGRRPGRNEDIIRVTRRGGFGRGRPPKGSELVYLQKSPNYCERDISKGSFGTAGRKCNRTSKGTDGCDLLCCGRGYNTHQLTRVWQCRCKFHWCCHVTCATCSEKIEEYTCK